MDKLRNWEVVKLAICAVVSEVNCDSLNAAKSRVSMAATWEVSKAEICSELNAVNCSVESAATLSVASVFNCSAVN